MKYVFLTIVLIFCISALFVTSAPTDDGHSLPKKMVMPAMAQKAGGSWRPELSPVSASPAPASHVIDTNGNLPTKNVGMPAMAQKAGGSWRRELMPATTAKPPDSTKESTYSNNQEEEDDYYDDDEIDCPRKMFFHVRSRMCVPNKCPRDTKRDKESGQCIAQFARLYNNRNVNYRPNLYVYRSPINKQKKFKFSKG